MPSSISNRLAVCSWSLQPSSPEELLAHLQEIGLSRVQIALDPIRERPEIWGSFAENARAAQMVLVSGMFGCLGEDYSSIESIRRTGGIVPNETWQENWENIQATAQLARQMDLKLVSFHAGFLPHDEADPEYASLLHRLRLVADLFASQGIDLALETGQETAPILRGFLEKLGRANVGVNFDPANMILYDKGDPIQALQILGPWLKQCHIKDGRRTRTPGAWGEEVVAGTGEVDWPAFFRTLDELKFGGYFCIEREAGHQRAADIRAARQFVESL
jgi:L-ribulose-5-phosphate 3-epimerase